MRMILTKVGDSERQYFVNNAGITAYIVLNHRTGGFPVISKCHFIAEYKTYAGAKKYLERNGFVEREVR